MSTPEAEWTADEVALFFASRQIEALRGPYGVPLDRAFARDATFVVDELPAFNKAVVAVEQARERYLKQWPDAPRAAMHWTVREASSPG